MDFKLDQVSLAQNIAMHAHREQKDLGGAPYLCHIGRVVLGVPDWDKDAQAVAFLHDVVEDGGFCVEALTARGVEARIVQAVDAISRRPGEMYEAYLLRVARNPLARKVKLADLHDNLDLARLKRPPTVQDFRRLAKYARATAYLMGIDQDEEAAAIRADLAINDMKNSGELDRMNDARALAFQLKEQQQWTSS